MEERKYKLTDETKGVFGVTLHRIVAIKDFANVKPGDKGGWVEKEDNLSHYGNAWVYDDAWVYGNARVYDDASVYGNARVYGKVWVYGNARVYGNAQVYGDAWVYGDAEVCNRADYIVFKNFWSSGRYFTWTRSNNKWKVGCFYGTGEELIAKAYKDSEKSGREYERVVRYVESILADEEKDKQNK